MICRLTDDSRFPWVKDRRKAAPEEIKREVYATASLHAAQLMATERRGYGRKVEVALSDALIARGSERVAAPNGGRIVAPNQHPRSDAHTSEPQSLMRTSYAVYCLKQNITYTSNI